MSATISQGSIGFSAAHLGDRAAAKPAVLPMTGSVAASIRKPRLLDLFCAAGGAGMGYHRAGFEVVGVDINPQPRYPFAFIQHDALTLDRRFMSMFDVIHASPPCQGYTDLRHAPGAIGAPRLIAEVRSVLGATGKPYVIENVDGAESEMIAPIRLCGSMYRLGAQGCQLQRHRWFESNIPLLSPACEHTEAPVIGVYGGHARKRSAKHGGRGTKDIWIGGHKAAASEAMGVDWMTLAEMSEAIPPAYTEFIGRQMIAHMIRQGSEADSLAAAGGEIVPFHEVCNAR